MDETVYLSADDERTYVSKLYTYANAFVSECRGFIYDPNLLELNEYAKKKHRNTLNKNKTNQSQSSNIGKYLAIVGILGLKFAVKSLGADLDISLPTDSIDIPDTPDFDTDIDFDSDYTPDAYSDLENQYNIPFEGNKTIGDKVYLDKGESITLKSAGGGLGEESPKVYVESGTNTRYILDGNTPRKIDGVNQITYNGKNWKVSK